MKKDKFAQFWNITANEWLKNGIVSKHDDENGDQEFKIKELCSFKPDCDNILYKNYTSLKKLLKDAYYSCPEKCKLSTYKRAAVLAYTVIVSDPLVYRDSKEANELFLKERLALRVALCSIVQTFVHSDEELKELTKDGKPVFHFDEVDRFTGKDEDSFLESVYKDMRFADLYQNYNILTMANVFGLLTVLASALPKNEKKEQTAKNQHHLPQQPESESTV